VRIGVDRLHADVGAAERTRVHPLDQAENVLGAQVAGG
jgi:hypothetical protein